MGVHINGGSRGVEPSGQPRQTDTNAARGLGERVRKSFPVLLSGLVARPKTNGGTDAPTVNRRTVLFGAAATAGGLLTAACSSSSPAPKQTSPAPKPKPSSSAVKEAAIEQLSATASVEMLAILALPRPSATGPGQAYDYLDALARQGEIDMTELVDALNKYRTAVAEAHLVEPKKIHDYRLKRDQAQIALFQAEGMSVDAAELNMKVDEQLPYSN